MTMAVKGSHSIAKVDFRMIDKSKNICYLKYNY